MKYMLNTIPFSNDKLDFSYPIPNCYNDLPSYYIHVFDNKVGVLDVNGNPLILNDGNLVYPSNKMIYIGMLDQKKIYALSLDEEIKSTNMSFISLGDLMHILDKNMLALAGRALQLVEFETNNKYCGKCGNLTKPLNDRGKKCTFCEVIVYPRISPAIIVMIRKEKKILMAKSSTFKPDQFKTLIAGFVEPGESLEHSVKREVREEVGIEIKNISYFASQPWPFPNSLMIGFFADYACGDINVDGKEILDAAWIGKDEIGEYNKISIAGCLLHQFLKE